MKKNNIIEVDRELFEEAVEHAKHVMSDSKKFPFTENIWRAELERTFRLGAKFEMRREKKHVAEDTALKERIKLLKWILGEE